MVTRRLLCALLLIAASTAAAAAQRLVLSAEQVDLPLGLGQDLALSLTWADGASEPALDLRLASLDTGALGYRFRQVRWQCALKVADDGMRCAGTAQAAGLRRGQLAIALHETALEASLGRAGASLQANYTFEQAQLALQAGELPLDWLKPLTDWLWAEASLQGGALSGALQLDLSREQRIGFEGRLSLADLGLDTPDGRIAAAGLGFDIELLGESGADGWTLKGEGPIRGGELLLGSLYAALPERGVDYAFALRGSEQGLAIERLQWTDAGVAELQASARIPAGTEGLPPELDLRLDLPDLSAAHARYGETALATLGLPGLGVSGKATATLRRQAARWTALELEGLTLDARDAQGRFAVSGLRGDLVWTAEVTSRGSRLAWNAAELYGLGLGQADLALQSRASGIGLAQATAMPALGGRLAVPRLHWLPAAGDEGPSLDLALELQELDLAALSQALGWPAFTGRISGSLPQAHYARGTLTLDGGLTMALFGGAVEIGQLILERPFGVAPTLNADVRFSGIDLQPLTTVFGFGEITGRLEGHIRSLRLVDWSPVAFDAQLRTMRDAPGPRRISQRAVRDLSSVGGGGFAGGLQAAVLKAFETFGYARIGLSCRLERNVCEMGGIDSSGQGYTIVEGSGLPRIQVVGFQRRVDWPVLVDRLKATAQGQSPTID